MEQNANLAMIAGQRLASAHLTFCAAESCTGGLLLSTLTDVPGSSAYVSGGVVTYSNEAKQNLLDVKESTLIEHGAVSAETAREMVIGVCDLFKADCGISVTGIAGPGGGTIEKPVGLVFVGARVQDKVVVRCFQWNGNRTENKIHSVAAAMELLLELLES